MSACSIRSSTYSSLGSWGAALRGEHPLPLAVPALVPRPMEGEDHVDVEAGALASRMAATSELYEVGCFLGFARCNYAFFGT